MTGGELSGFFCHPAHATVELASGRSVRLDHLAIGERIRTPYGFEPVVGFLHADPNARVLFHVLSTSEGRTIEISGRHWLFLDGAEADPASAHVGQNLSTFPGGQQALTSISTALRLGAYHLMTPSGQYYVDGVLASTYLAYLPKTVWRIIGDGYVHLRFAVGLPITPEGQSVLPLFWFLDLMCYLAIPAALQASFVCWLPTGFRLCSPLC